MRNPLHAICPYFAMFPESFVTTHLFAHSRPGDLVFDPFSGRGTTILESLLRDRKAIASDINPVAACVSGAKARVPDLQSTLSRLSDLESEFREANPSNELINEFFDLCFHPATLREVLYLRSVLKWREHDTDRFISAVMLGCLHGESHRSELYLSNRMPRTISTKPDYSVRWWTSRGLIAPERRTFEILRRLVKYRLSGQLPTREGEVALADARQSGTVFRAYSGQVGLILTSPPYIDTTDYSEDQWLRLWFLGGAERPQARINRDDRHRSRQSYWSFLAEAWLGCGGLLKDESTIVVRIGGNKLGKAELFEGLTQSLIVGLAGRRVAPLHKGTTTSIARRQTNSFRPGTAAGGVEHDFTFRLS